MDNTKKFSGRADDYVKGRPGYPNALIDCLYTKYGFTDSSSIADVGAGTGKFSKYLLDRGSRVYLVEPNDDMRSAAQKELSVYSNAVFVDGSSESTSLRDHSVDFVTAAQAFHWFDADKFKTECKRILKPGGKIVLLWNTRDMSSDFNLESYAIYKKYCPLFKGYHGGMKDNDERIAEFFNHNYDKFIFENPIEFTKDKFIRRSLSASYSLKDDDEGFALYVRELECLFDKYSRNGIVVMENNTTVYIG